VNTLPTTWAHRLCIAPVYRDLLQHRISDLTESHFLAIKNPEEAPGLFTATINLFQPFGMEHTFFIGAFVGMRTEVVTLGLNQVSRQNRSTVAVVVGTAAEKVGTGIPFCTA
jgi:hypothetical protein